jgi:predicted anti-sigma-YlaC factor YlaD
MKLECKQVWEYISDYLDQQLAPEVRAEIEKHLGNCEACSATLDSTRNVLILTADNRMYELPVGYSKRLHDRLEKAIHEKPDHGRPG